MAQVPQFWTEGENQAQALCFIRHTNLMSICFLFPHFESEKYCIVIAHVENSVLFKVVAILVVYDLFL